jgi:DNA-binding sugar fermentation-stimulating protein
MNGKIALNQGMLFENIIAQMITAKGKKLYFYTRYNEEKHRNDIEIDFLISNESKTSFKIFPIEVKSAKNYTTTSLSRFNEIYSKRIDQSYIIHPKNYIKEKNVIKIPPYMFFCLF